jgi:hypothetical protein
MESDLRRLTLWRARSQGKKRLAGSKAWKKKGASANASLRGEVTGD